MGKMGRVWRASERRGGIKRHREQPSDRLDERKQRGGQREMEISYL